MTKVKTPPPVTPVADTLDEWVNWRGRIVRYFDYSWGTPKLSRLKYVVAGGNIARYVRAAEGEDFAARRGCRIEDLLVLIPLTRDTDDDSFEMAPREDIVVPLRWTRKVVY